MFCVSRHDLTDKIEMNDSIKYSKLFQFMLKNDYIVYFEDYYECQIKMEMPITVFFDFTARKMWAKNWFYGINALINIMSIVFELKLFDIDEYLVFNIACEKICSMDYNFLILKNYSCGFISVHDPIKIIDVDGKKYLLSDKKLNHEIMCDLFLKKSYNEDNLVLFLRVWGKQISKGYKYSLNDFRIALIRTQWSYERERILILHELLQETGCIDYEKECLDLGVKMSREKLDSYKLLFYDIKHQERAYCVLNNILYFTKSIKYQWIQTVYLFTRKT